MLPDKGITLGLDLQGGIHLVLEVEEDRAVEIAVERTAASLRICSVEKKDSAESVKRTIGCRFTIGFFKMQERRLRCRTVDDSRPTWRRSRLAQGTPWCGGCARRRSKRIKDSAINQALETIRNRIDQFGVAEPLIQRQGLLAGGGAAAWDQRCQVGQRI